MSIYPTTETFLSVQGEGMHMGRRAYFIRLFGCPIRCPWCDSKDSWARKASEELGVSDLARRVEISGAEIAVITGGEPCMHDLLPLLAKLNSMKVACHLETSGIFPICETVEAKFSWVALSPKLFANADKGALERADELKFIVSDFTDLLSYEKLAAAAKNAKALWLHPEWSKAENKELLRALADYVKERGGLWRIGWQIHKNYGVR